MADNHFLGAALLAGTPRAGECPDHAERKTNRFRSRSWGAAGKENGAGASRRDGGKRKRHGGGSQAVDLPQQRDDASGASTSASNQAVAMLLAPTLAAPAHLGFIGAGWPAPMLPARAEPAATARPEPQSCASSFGGPSEDAADASRGGGAPAVFQPSRPEPSAPAAGGKTSPMQPHSDFTRPLAPEGQSAPARGISAADAEPRPLPESAGPAAQQSSQVQQPASAQRVEPALAVQPAFTSSALAADTSQRGQQPQRAEPQPVTPAVETAAAPAAPAVAAAPARKPPVRRQPAARKPTARKPRQPARSAAKPPQTSPAEAAAAAAGNADGEQTAGGAAAAQRRQQPQRRRLQKMTLEFSSGDSGESSCSDAEQALRRDADAASSSGGSDMEAEEVSLPPNRRRAAAGASAAPGAAGAAKRKAAAAPRKPRKRAASSTAGATQGAADQPLPQGETAAARADSRPQAKRRASGPAWTGISANGKPRTSAKAAAGNQRNNFVRINMKGGGRFSFQSKSGGSSRRKGPSRFGGRGDCGFMKQAGEGADYMEGCEGMRSQRCFKCGGTGHWAAECKGLEADGAEGEVQPRVTARAAAAAAVRPVNIRPAGNMWAPEGGYAALAENPTEEGLQEVVRNVFGFPGFRGNQAAVVQAVLRGRSTLAIMPTGAGKSLCYQLPAVVGGGTVLVVSPLLALMRDQLDHLPPGLPAAMLCGGQPRAEARQVLDDLKAGKLRVLLVAPERLHSAALREALAPLLPLPLIAVDEAHCVAEWGHNFRSAYFRLGHMLRTAVRAKALLALTATATAATASDIASVLGIETEDIVRDDSLRANLRLAVTHHNGGSEGGATRRAVLRMLQGGALADAASVIVYCTYQAQCSDLAGFLSTRGVVAAAYHAGKPMQEREAVQEAFCSGKLRVVVATVAFGMGLDARSVRAVVHAAMPRSPEEYVQHVGRAGRDGGPASCHLFLDDADFLRLRSLAHSDGVDAPSIAAFLRAAFGEPPPHGDAADAEPRCRFRVLSAKPLALSLDMRQEVMETLLSYLEAGEDPYLHVLSGTGSSVQAAFYNTDADELAARHPAVAALLAAAKKPRNGCYKAATADLVAAADCPPYQVMRELQELAAGLELRFEVSRDPALCFEVLRAPEDIPSLAESLARRTAAAGRAQLARLDTAYRTFASAAVASASPAQQEARLRSAIATYFEQPAAVGAVAVEGDGDGVDGDAAGASGGESPQQAADTVAAAAGEQAPEPLAAAPAAVAAVPPPAESAAAEQEKEVELVGLPVKAGHTSLSLDCRELLAYARRNSQVAGLSARALARVLHGLSSPAFPADRWTKSGVWGRYAAVDFSAVHLACQAVLDAKKQQAMAA